MKRVSTIAAAVALACASVAGQAYEQGDWILRVGATTVDPDSESDTINLPTGLEAKAEVDSDTQLGIIPAYMITDQLAIEVLAATPFEHNIEAQGQGAISGTNLDAGSTKQLPPTVSLQWYPLAGPGRWQPYIGAGLNYTVFFDENVDSQLVGLLGSLTGGAVNDADLSLDDSFGIAFQAGQHRASGFAHFSDLIQTRTHASQMMIQTAKHKRNGWPHSQQRRSMAVQCAGYGAGPLGRGQLHLT